MVCLFHRYYQLDLQESLDTNLKGKVIVEYPTMHVVIKGMCQDYKILGQGLYISVYPLRY